MALDGAALPVNGQKVDKAADARGGLERLLAAWPVSHRQHFDLALVPRAA